MIQFKVQMFYTPKIRKAIEIAKKAHTGALRKDNYSPYITHPLTIALILARAGAEEDLICAGILHDTIEDSPEGDKITLDFLTKEFGENVSRMVKDVTEEDKTLDWEKRKEQASKKIPTMQKDSLLLKTADLLHNITDIVVGLETTGSDYLKTFNSTPTKMEANYSEKYELLKNAWAENPLLPELLEVLNKLRVLL